MSFTKKSVGEPGLPRRAVRGSRPIVFRRALAIITILAIAGTLSSCGRYGSPVRVAPAAVTKVQDEVRVRTETETEDTKAKGLDDGELSAGPSGNNRAE